MANNCIGANNQRSFIGFTVALLLAQLLYLRLSTLYFLRAVGSSLVLSPHQQMAAAKVLLLAARQLPGLVLLTFLHVRPLCLAWTSCITLLNPSLRLGIIACLQLKTSRSPRVSLHREHTLHCPAIAAGGFADCCSLAARLVTGNPLMHLQAAGCCSFSAAQSSCFICIQSQLRAHSAVSTCCCMCRSPWQSAMSSWSCEQPVVSQPTSRCASC